MEVLLLFLGPIVSIGLAIGFGVFKPKSIVGPERFSPGEGALPLLGIFLTGLLALMFLSAPLARPFHFVDAQDALSRVARRPSFLRLCSW